MDENIVRILREREELIQQLQLDLRRCESKRKMMEEVAQEAEDDAKRARAEFAEFKEKVGLRSEGSMRELRGSISELEGELEEVRADRDLLQSSVTRLENLLEEERRAKPIEESFHQNESLCTGHEEEIKLLREELEELFEWKMSAEDNVKNLSRELMETRERADDAMQEGNMLRRNLNEARDQLREVEDQLDRVKHNTHFSAKGNSMFSEFVDERKKLEDDLKELNHENLSLRQEVRSLHSEIEELTLQKATGTGVAMRLPCKCEDLMAELKEVRSERDKAVEKAQQAVMASVKELRDNGTLESTQRKRMGELRADIKRYHMENDRMRRKMDSLKNELMNVKVDMATFKEKSEMNGEEVKRLNELLVNLRKKHATFTRPTAPSSTASLAAAFARETGAAAPAAGPSGSMQQLQQRATGLSSFMGVPQTPASSARASSSFFSSVTASGRGRDWPMMGELNTPASGLKRPRETMTAEELVQMKLKEDERVVEQSSINSSISSIRRRNGPVKKPKFLSKVISSSCAPSMQLEVKREENEEKMEESVIEVIEEKDEKSNGSIEDATLQNGTLKKEEEEKEREEEKEGEEGTENHDPSFLMSKQRLPADNNLEATVLEETFLN